MAGRPIVLPHTSRVRFTHRRHTTHTTSYDNRLRMNQPESMILSNYMGNPYTRPPDVVEVGPYAAGTEIVIELSDGPSGPGDASSATLDPFSGDPFWWNTNTGAAPVYSSSWDPNGGLGYGEWVFEWEDSGNEFALPTDTLTTVTLLDPPGGFIVGRVGIAPGNGIA